MSTISRSIFCLAAAAVLNPIPVQSASGSGQSPGEDTVQAQTASFRYVGLRRCSAAACHGRQWPVANDSILHNEYQTWASSDKHSNAFFLLYSPESQKMAERLNLGEDPTQAERCLTCHSVPAPDPSEGISCEACHGPASGWGETHYVKGQTRAQSLATGLFDTQDPKRRAQLCLSCHVGAPGRNVDHELIAAGHPDLVFEIGAYSQRMPRHWRRDLTPWQGARLWMIGQALSLGHRLEQLKRRTDPGSWYPLDFADLECNSCHHSLLQPSWRQTRGFVASPGLPPFDLSAYLAWRRLPQIVFAGEREPLGPAMDRLKDAVNEPSASRQAIGRHIDEISRIVDRYVSRFSSLEIDLQVVTQIISAIAADSGTISSAGIRAAEQATLALESLYRSVRDSTGRADPEMEGRINRLHEILQDYDPQRFSEALDDVAKGWPSSEEEL